MLPLGSAQEWNANSTHINYLICSLLAFHEDMVVIGIASVSISTSLFAMRIG